jgi:hypothetical protein
VIDNRDAIFWKQQDPPTITADCGTPSPVVIAVNFSFSIELSVTWNLARNGDLRNHPIKYLPVGVTLVS